MAQAETPAGSPGTGDGVWGAGHGLRCAGAAARDPQRAGVHDLPLQAEHLVRDVLRYHFRRRRPHVGLSTLDILDCRDTDWRTVLAHCILDACQELVWRDREHIDQPLLHVVKVNVQVPDDVLELDFAWARRWRGRLGGEPPPAVLELRGRDVHRAVAGVGQDPDGALEGRHDVGAVDCRRDVRDRQDHLPRKRLGLVGNGRRSHRFRSIEGEVVHFLGPGALVLAHDVGAHGSVARVPAVRAGVLALERVVQVQHEAARLVEQLDLRVRAAAAHHAP
mmetsp:Transcript_18084/g.57410  ORF Transcript_18084/g.57410 Transcript_18084/m.57410 type:complete len:278 (+) Transcript_18084:59-892(+)